MTMPKGYKLPQAERERLAKLERENEKLRNASRGFDFEYQARVQQAQRRRLQKMALGIVGLCMVPVLIVAAAITMNWYLIGAFLVVYAIIAGYAFLGGNNGSQHHHKNDTAYAAGHYSAARIGRTFRMWAAHKRN